MFPSVKFRLNEFKALGRWVEKNLPPWAAWLVNAFLYGLEDRWIDAKITSTLDKAERAYRASQGPLIAPPVFTSKESEVDGLDEIQLTAPWILNNSNKN